MSPQLNDPAGRHRPVVGFTSKPAWQLHVPLVRQLPQSDDTDASSLQVWSIPKVQTGSVPPSCPASD